MRVIIADEDPSIRRMLTRLLIRDVGCAVTECADGLEVLDVLSRQRVDLLVTDLVLPHVDGFEVIETIRAHETVADLPIVVVSNVRREGDVRRVVRLGVTAYIAKPLRPADLAERLAGIIGSLTPRTSGQLSRTLRGIPKGARLLLVDADRDYRHFVRSTLGHDYLVAEAVSGAQGLRSCLQHPPSAVLLGPDIGMLGRETFLQKLRIEPTLAGVPVILTSASPRDAQGLDADAAIPRSYVPGVLKDHFEALVAVPATAAGVVAARPDLWRHTLSATEQVFGMMLGLSVYAESGQAHPADDDDLAFITLTLETLGEVAIGIASPRAHSERMTQAFLQQDTPVAPEDVEGTLQELANMIGGRVLDALRSQGDVGRIGLPVVTSATHQASPLAGQGPRAAFSDPDRSLRFAVGAADAVAG